MEVIKRKERNSVLTFIIAIVAAVLVGLGVNTMNSEAEKVEMTYELEGRR